MSFLSDLFWGLYFFLRGLVDVVLRRRRRRYVSATHIRAPRDVVWDAVTAETISFDGLVPIGITTGLHDGAENIYRANVRVGDTDIPMAYREIERRPPEGLVIEMLKDRMAATRVSCLARIISSCARWRKGTGARC